MKTLMRTAVCSLLCLHFIAHSQDFKISWGDNSKAAWDYDDAIQLNNGNYLMLKFEKLKAFKAYKDMTPDPILMLVDPAMNPVKETKCEIDEKDDDDRALKKYGNSVFLTYSAYSNNETSVYAVKVNEQNLSLGKKITLGSFDSEGMGRPEITYKLSADSSKVLLFAEGSARKKDNKQFYIGVFDTTLKKIWSRYIELPVGARFISVYDQDITNGGKVYVAIKQYDKEVTPETVRERRDKVPPYGYKLFAYSKEGPPKELSFDLKNQFIEGTKLLFGQDGSVTAAGLYKKKHNGNVTGAFYTVFDSTASVVSPKQVLAFPQDIIALVDKDGQGKSTGSDPGVYPDLRITDILQRANGTIDLISELQASSYNIESNGKVTYRYIHGDIININMDKAGNTIFTRIPKQQEGYKSNWGLGYYPIGYGDKLVFVYNDHPDNITRDLSKGTEHFMPTKKTVLIAATVDAKGNLTRKPVYEFRDEKRLALPREFSRISANKYLMVSLGASFMTRRIGFGMLEIK